MKSTMYTPEYLLKTLKEAKDALNNPVDHDIPELVARLDFIITQADKIYN